MTNDTLPELLPCPFCGDEPRIGDSWASLPETKTEHWYNISCSNCHIGTVKFPKLEIAVTRWNQRPTPATPDLQGAVETIAKWMLHHSFATGHGDTVEGLLNELSWQIAELRRAAGYDVTICVGGE